ncbi:hypothetical protein BBK36DRAFT_3601 [Trichoderma citrinoviride]|uniref:Uncharacterized protein n=1 Tax=Trichoderma citrinoviride TaxID=58853 RepID=A0A2T4BE37_9HYPO|nr:hypothetical protein BBK36DRAFT_3601 [Trichoderma citrinoviride]PTB67592.1 hypothetical protein BBK36DRAFT_3601 [Trichoderma citrinoviride]
MAPSTTKTLLLALTLSLLATNPATAAALLGEEDHENAPEANNNTTGGGCTTTSTLTLSRLSTPPYWPQCSWDGTLSIYSSTATATRSVDCHGCTDVRITAVPAVHCPAKIISTIVRVGTATTTYKTVCSVTPAASHS